jgi:hypothetical protein
MRQVRKKLLVALLVALLVTPALAGAKIKIDDEAEIDLGFRVQTLYLSTDSDLDGDGDFESFDDFRLRRGRIRLGAKINPKVSIFIQTDVSGNEVRFIDAFVNLKADPWAQFIAGINMVPANRQNLTSSGALMAGDRPGIVYKSLTWGGRALTRFSTSTIGGTDSGQRGNTQVRDVGLTLFGSGDVGDSAHLKYYVGIYNGIQASAEDNERTAARVQLNLWDPEPGYYNSSTYLGKKRTLAFGASIDQQDDIVTGVDYSYFSGDAFLELPAGPGAITAEAAIMDLDLDDVSELSAVQGDGYYAQAGYVFKRWQPWVMYEEWDSDDPLGVGSFSQYRMGLTYFLRGHNANIKLGYEKLETDTPIPGTVEDTISTVLLGVYTTF